MGEGDTYGDEIRENPQRGAKGRKGSAEGEGVRERWTDTSREKKRARAREMKMERKREIGF